MLGTGNGQTNTIKIIEVVPAKGFPGGYVSTTAEGMTFVSLLFDHALSDKYLGDETTVSFSKKQTNYQEKWAEFKREIAQRTIQHAATSSKELGIDKKCLFVETHASKKGLMPQHLTDGYIGLEGFNASRFAKNLMKSVNCQKFDSIFLSGCFASSHATEIAQITGRAVIAPDGIDRQVSIKSESENLNPQIFRWVIETEKLSKFNEVACNYAQLYDSLNTAIENIRKEDTFPEELEKEINAVKSFLVGFYLLKNPSYFTETFSPSEFPDLYGQLWRHNPNGEKHILSANEYPKIMRKGSKDSSEKIDTENYHVNFSCEIPNTGTPKKFTYKNRFTHKNSGNGRHYIPLNLHPEKSQTRS